MGIDIAERKRAEKQLRDSSLYSHSLIKASLGPLVNINVESKITDVHQATMSELSKVLIIFAQNLKREWQSSDNS